ncbi:MAG: 50S ribosomal protein L11 methyltransferase, partial [bacterium]
SLSQAARQSISFQLSDAAAEWAGAALTEFFPDGLLLEPSVGGVTRLRGWLPAGKARLAPKALGRLAGLGACRVRLLRRPTIHAKPPALYGRFPTQRVGPFLILAASAPKASPGSGAAPAALGLGSAILERGRAGNPAPRIPIVLTQGQAFGSGRHESTRLMLESLTARPPRAREVLDVGAGSGILGFACLSLGASRVNAVELESAACVELRLNRGLNRVPAKCLPVLCGRFPLQGMRGRRYDLVLANLVTPILLDLMPHLVRALAPGGALLCGGIHTPREAQAVAFAARGRGLLLEDRRVLRRWHVLRFQHA